MTNLSQSPSMTSSMRRLLRTVFSRLEGCTEPQELRFTGTTTAPYSLRSPENLPSEPTLLPTISTLSTAKPTSKPIILPLLIPCQKLPPLRQLPKFHGMKLIVDLVISRSLQSQRGGSGISI